MRRDFARDADPSGLPRHAYHAARGGLGHGCCHPCLNADRSTALGGLRRRATAPRAVSVDPARDYEEPGRVAVPSARPRLSLGYPQRTHPASDRWSPPPRRRLRDADDRAGDGDGDVCAVRLRWAAQSSSLVRLRPGMTVPLRPVERADSVRQQGLPPALSRPHRGEADDAGGDGDADGAADHRSVRLAACLGLGSPREPPVAGVRRTRAPLPRSALLSPPVQVDH